MGVTVGVVVVPAVGAVVGFGVVVAFAFTVGFSVTAGVVVGVGSKVVATIGVGLINITRIAPSSGTGETTFFPETRTPIIITTKTITPIMMVRAAIVFLRSSIDITISHHGNVKRTYLISSFFHAAKVQVG